MDTILQDGLRGAIQDIDAGIKTIRIKLRKGLPVKGTMYLAAVRRANELAEAGKAQGMTGDFYEPRMPMPINPGFVGLSPAEQFRREWHLETAPVVALRKAA
jgi:hypothetical protein